MKMEQLEKKIEQLNLFINSQPSDVQSSAQFGQEIVNVLAGIALHLKLLEQEIGVSDAFITELDNPNRFGATKITKF